MMDELERKVDAIVNRIHSLNRTNSVNESVHSPERENGQGPSQAFRHESPGSVAVAKSQNKSSEKVIQEESESCFKNVCAIMKDLSNGFGEVSISNNNLGSDVVDSFVNNERTKIMHVDANASLGVNGVTCVNQILKCPKFNPDEKSNEEANESIFQNTKVLEKVFKLLDQKSLGNCRLVSQTWNQTAIPFYSKFSFTFGLYRNPITNKTRIQKIEEFCKIMNACPLGLVQNVRLDFENVNFNGVQDWFRKHGPYLNSVCIQGPFNEGIVCGILLMCTNLQYLGLCNFSRRPEEIRIQYKPLAPKFSTPFSMKTIVLTKGYAEASIGSNCWELSLETQISFASSIIANCPELKYLTVNLGDSSNSFKQLMAALSCNTNITQNLVELNLGSDHRVTALLRSLNPVTGISFSHRLKRLYLRDFRDEKRQGQSGLLQILNNVAGSLESLSLSGGYLLHEEATRLNVVNFNFKGYNAPMCLASAEVIQFPTMLKLRWFENWSMQQFKLNSLNFVHQFPYLCKMVIYGDPASAFTMMIMNNFGNPHRYLRELELRQTITDNRALNTVVYGFPELTSVRLAIGSGLVDSFGFIRPDKMLTGALSFLSLLKNLKSLVLEFTYTYHPEESYLGIGRLFGLFKSLESVTLIGNTRWMDGQQQIYLRTITEGILMAKNLKRLQLVNISMNVADVKRLLEIGRERNLIVDLDS